MDRSTPASADLLNFNHIHYFHVVAEEGSLSRAAKRLSVTKPTISGQLRQLEDALGVELFDRSNGRLRLSSAGTAAFRYTTAMFTAGTDLLKHFRAVDEAPRARLRIGVAMSVTSAATAELFNPLLELDRVQLDIRSGAHPELRGELLRSEIDVLVTDTPPADADADDLEVELVREEPLVAAGRADLTASYASLAETLQHRPLLHYTHEAELYSTVERLLSALEVEPDVLAYASDVPTLASLATGCDGIVVAPVDALRPFLDSGRLNELHRPPQVLSRTYAVVVKRQARELVRQAVERLTRLPAPAS